MNLSRFFGSTNREALRQVRLALGPEALIVSNKRVNGGVEILASDPTSPSIKAGSENAAPGSVSTGGANVIDAIGAMRGALETRFDELLWGSQLRQAPQVAQLFQALMGLGFSTALLRAMLQRITQGLSFAAAMQWVRKELTGHLPILANEGDLWRPGLVLALVGPTGVGKTTTIAKLAARCIKQTGPGRLVLLTTDTYRIGAHEQLKLYGDMMHIPVHVVQDAAELKRIVSSTEPDQTILIDNVGISQRDHYVSEQARMLADAGRPVSRLLVLNASSHGDTLDEVARTYSNDGGGRLRGCIVTKIDEASRIAPVLDTAIRYRLPVCYVSNGQRVPEDLMFLSASELIDQALAPRHRSRDLYAPTEADFAALMSMAGASGPATPEQTAEQRRKHLLPRLLSTMSGMANPSLAQEDIQRACAAIDALKACSEAFELWRSWADNANQPDVAPIVRHLIRASAGRHAESAGSRLLALHGRAQLDPAGIRRGRLQGAVLLNGTMEAMTAPVQQLEFADGWQSSWGETSPLALRSDDALSRQICWLERNSQDSPLVHLVGSASPAVLRKLCSLGPVWLAQCAARTRIVSDLCVTDLGAVANDLEFRPVEVRDRALLNGLFPGDIALWAGHGSVGLVQRNDASFPLRAIVLRVVDRGSGVVIKTVYGLSNADSADASADMLVAWLAVQLHSTTIFRHAAHGWRYLGASGPADAVALQKALLAAQLGLAAWQAGASEELRPVLNAFGAKASSATLLPAVLKLFALKEMLD